MSLSDADRTALDRAISDFEAALNSVPDGAADDMLREAMRRMIDVAQQHEKMLEKLVTDSELNNSPALLMMGTRLLDPANRLLARLKATGQLRPISDMIVARTVISLFMGIIASERATPQLARIAMRLFPQRAWIDGMVDVLLYGLLEDDART